MSKTVKGKKYSKGNSMNQYKQLESQRTRSRDKQALNNDPDSLPSKQTSRKRWDNWNWD